MKTCPRPTTKLRVRGSSSHHRILTYKENGREREMSEILFSGRNHKNIDIGETGEGSGGWKGRFYFIMYFQHYYRQQ